MIPGLVKAAFKRLNLCKFYTAGPKEVHSWTTRKGTNVVKAAGAIHSDFEKGFIWAEIMRYEDLKKHNFSEKNLIKAGQGYIEGKDYAIKDGDIINIKFNPKYIKINKDD